jgi:DNA-binding MarR family transcriptional regulator
MLDVDKSSDVAKRPLSEEDYEALARFRQALRNFMAFSDSMLESAGLGPRRYQAMLAVRARAGGERLSVGELADLLLIKPNTAAELVNRLEDAGLVERVRDRMDKRRALLTLTPEGARRLDEVAQHHLAKLEESRAAFLKLFQMAREAEMQGEPGATAPEG